MIETPVEFHIDIDHIFEYFRVSQLHDTQTSGTYHIGGEIQDELFVFAQQVFHPCFTDHLFGFFDCVVLPAGQGSSCFVLEVLDDLDLPGELGLDDGSFPFAQRRGIEASEVVDIVVVEIADQLLLGELAVFSALFEVFVEVQILP